MICKIVKSFVLWQKIQPTTGLTWMTFHNFANFSFVLSATLCNVCDSTFSMFSGVIKSTEFVCSPCSASHNKVVFKIVE